MIKPGSFWQTSMNILPNGNRVMVERKTRTHVRYMYLNNGNRVQLELRMFIKNFVPSHIDVRDITNINRRLFNAIF